MKYTIILRLIEEKENSAALRPVKIIVTIKGRRAVISTGIRVKESDWDVDKVISSHVHAKEYNAIIRKKLVEVEQKILKALNEDGDISIDLFKSQKNYKVCEYFEKLIEQLKSKYRPGTIRIYRVQLKKLKEFSPDITFNNMDSAWLRAYEDHLRQKGYASNYVFISFKVLRKVFNVAIADGITKNYPFKGNDNPKYRNPERVYLTLKEIKKFEAALNKPMDRSMYVTGKYFLLGCYSGLRVSDWLRFNKSFIQGERLILHAFKNGELVSMKMNSKLKELTKELLKLPPPPTEQWMNKFVKDIATVAGIKKKLHLHASRHSFATACAESGISMETTSRLMGITLQSAGVYYRITGTKIDKEFEKFGK